jgi:hypothetical protein
MLHDPEQTDKWMWCEYFPVFPNEINIQRYNWKFRIWRSGLGSHVYETDCSFILLQWYSTDRLIKAHNFFHGKAGPRQEHDRVGRVLW